MSAEQSPLRRTSVDTAGWRVLLPPGWTTLPTEQDAGRAAVTALLDRMVEGKPRDEFVPLRIELDRALRSQLARARRQGATHLHALTEPVRGLPVSASLVTTTVRTGDPEEIAAAVSAVLGAAEGVVDHGNVDLGPMGALRRVRRVRRAVEPAPDTEQQLTHVDYVVPVDEGSVLVMTFTTSTEPIWQDLVVLFDAIATTLHRPA